MAPAAAPRCGAVVQHITSADVRWAALGRHAGLPWLPEKGVWPPSMHMWPGLRMGARSRGRQPTRTMEKWRYKTKQEKLAHRTAWQPKTRRIQGLLAY